VILSHSPSQYTPDWLHFTRGNGCGSGLVDQARRSYHWIPVAGFPPRSNTPASRNTDCPSRSHLLLFPRCSRVFGGLRGTDIRPSTSTIEIYYFNQLVDFEVPQLWRFIDHSEDLRQAMRCFVEFQDDRGYFGAGPSTHIPESESFDDFPRNMNINILCEGIDWQVSHMAQALNQISAVLSNMLHFAIIADESDPNQRIWTISIGCNSSAHSPPYRRCSSPGNLQGKFPVH
jgi:hypothetical protein